MGWSLNERKMFLCGLFVLSALKLYKYIRNRIVFSVCYSHSQTFDCNICFTANPLPLWPIEHARKKQFSSNHRYEFASMKNGNHSSFFFFGSHFFECNLCRAMYGLRGFPLNKMNCIIFNHGILKWWSGHTHASAIPSKNATKNVPMS